MNDTARVVVRPVEQHLGRVRLPAVLGQRDVRRRLGRVDLGLRAAQPDERGLRAGVEVAPATARSPGRCRA